MALPRGRKPSPLVVDTKSPLWGTVTLYHHGTSRGSRRGLVTIRGVPCVVELMDRWIRVYRAISIHAPAPASSIAAVERPSGRDPSDIAPAILRCLEAANDSAARHDGTARIVNGRVVADKAPGARWCLAVAMLTPAGYLGGFLREDPLPNGAKVTTWMGDAALFANEGEATEAGKEIDRHLGGDHVRWRVLPYNPNGYVAEPGIVVCWPMPATEGLS